MTPLARRRRPSRCLRDRSPHLLILASLGLLLALDSSSAADKPGSKTPPFDRGLLPKVETGATRLLATNKNLDGRGVVVAIFDTGVDPGAAGLRTTTEGKIKVIDLIDGTGSGDVNTSTVRPASGGKILGLTGRTLSIPADWKNPRGEYHLGWKQAFDLFPASLVGRLKSERRRDWERHQRTTHSRLKQELQSWDRQHPRPTASQRLEREELAERITQLAATGRNVADPGPIFDCVVFHDGKRWRAAVDTDEDGDLADETVLTNYRDEPAFGTFSKASLLNFSVNIFDNGNTLSIVTTCGAHGTHVAGIVAAHYPGQPQRNGLAPGAQIVSVKIGDTRLGSMETGAGLVRGLRAVLRNKCDLVNMSYGEPSNLPDTGRLTSLFSELVNRHRVVFVASAGNAGPALSTVGSPGGTTSALLGVGAYVSPEMMRSEYSLRKILPGMPYTWTSRGPTSDGDSGVDIFAPGGAIAPVPTWTLQASMRMNGTSMSSPNACGNLALLVSALKQHEIDYTPTSLRRAIQNTARPIKGTAADGFGQGPGLLQVDKAWQYLQDHAKSPGEQVPIDVRVSGGRGRRGVYLRDAHQTARPVSRLVRLSPRFPEMTDNNNRIAYRLKLDLEATADWIDCGKQVLLTHGGASFNATIDPTHLTPGAHFGEVLIRDSERPARGPVARVPITVLKPHPTTGPSTTSWQEVLAFEPGQVTRRFLDVPRGASWADISLTLHPDTAKAPASEPPSSDPAKRPDTAGRNRRFVLHTVQLRPGRSFSNDQSRLYLTLRPGAETVQSVPVTPGRLLEVCISQYWSSLGASSVDCAVRFHGIVPDQHSLSLTAGQGGSRVRLHNELTAERLAPQASLSTHRTLISPNRSVLEPLSVERDSLPRDRQISRLLLEYTFEQKRSGTLTPRFPDLDGMLYDSPFGTQLWMVFDSNKRRVACDDTFPDSLRLPAGSYVLRMQLRHTDEGVLARHKKLLLALDRKLSKTIKLSFAANRTARARGSSATPSGSLAIGQTRSLFIVSPTRAQIPSSVSGGELLLGSVTYGRNDTSRHGAGRRPGGYPLSILVPGTPQAKPAAKKRPAGDFAKDQHQFLVDRLQRIPFETRRKEFEELAVKLLKVRPKHPTVLITRLERLDHRDHRKTRLTEVVAAADAVIATIDIDKLARTLGRRGGRSADRDVLIDALYRKGRALAYMELPDVIKKHPVADKPAHDKAFKDNFKELSNWVDTTEKKYVLLHIRRERRRGRPAVALKWLQKYYPGTPPNFWYVKKRRDLFENLGWSHCLQYEQRWLLVRFPKTYESF